jgi:hypothetical protein
MQLEPRVLLAQITATIAEQLAREVAYHDWANGATVKFQGANMNYVVSQQWHDDKTGFDAYGLTYADGSEPVLVLRGSEFFPNSFKYKDLASDADPRGVGYDQFSKNWHAVSGWLAARNSSVDFVGHSLGGALAQWFAALWSNAPGFGGKPVDHVHTFCSPGISDSRVVNPLLMTYASGAAVFPSGPGFDPTKANSVTHHVALGDIVVMAGEKYIQGDVVTYDWRTLQLQLKHIQPFLNATVTPKPNENIGAPNPAPTVGGMTSAALSAANYVHNDPDYRANIATLQVTANAVARVVPGLAPLRLAPAILMRRDTVEIGRKILGAVLRAVTDQFDLTKEGDVWKITLGGQTNGLFKATTFYIDPSVQITVDAGATPSLKVAGKMRLNIPVNFQVPMPAPFQAIQVNNLVQLPTLDVNGVIDADSMRVSGTLSVLGGATSNFGTVNGTITFNWKRGEIGISGDTNFLDNFIRTEGGMTVSSKLTIVGDGDATVRVPAGIKFVGGKQLASGKFTFSFDPNNLPGSFIEGVGEYQPAAFMPVVRAGARATLTPSLSVILGNRLIPIFRTPQRGGPTGGAGFEVTSSQQFLVMQAAWPTPAPSAQIIVTRPDGTFLDESAIAASPDIRMIPGLTDSNTRTVLVKTPAIGLWRIDPVNPPAGTVEYEGYVDMPPVQLSFGTNTGGLRRQDVQLHVNVTDPVGTAKVSLYYDNDALNIEGALIAAGLTPSAGVVDYTWDVSAVPTGNAHVYAVAVEDANVLAVTHAPQPVLITEVRPTVLSKSFVFENFQAMEVEFDQDVGASLSLSDFTLKNLTTNQTIPAGMLTLSYNSFLSTATIDVNGILPSGDYQLTAPASAITNADGESLDLGLSYDFFFLIGDADHNGVVDGDDYVYIDQGFNLQLTGYSNGDFDYNGIIDADDYAIIDFAFNTQ